MRQLLSLLSLAAVLLLAACGPAPTAPDPVDDGAPFGELSEGVSPAGG